MAAPQREHHHCRQPGLAHRLFARTGVEVLSRSRPVKTEPSMNTKQNSISVTGAPTCSRLWVAAPPGSPLVTGDVLSRPQVGAPAAFTLMELLVVIAMLALGLAMLSPAFARTRTNSPALQCMNNARQMAMGWIIYSGDNGGSLAPNSDGVNAGKTSTSPAWVADWLDFTSSTDNTNTAMLVDHDSTPSARSWACMSARAPPSSSVRGTTPLLRWGAWQCLARAASR